MIIVIAIRRQRKPAYAEHIVAMVTVGGLRTAAQKRDLKQWLLLRRHF